jgi:hypothetical protein
MNSSALQLSFGPLKIDVGTSELRRHVRRVADVFQEMADFGGAKAENFAIMRFD